jgi:hypothetical protein
MDGNMQGLMAPAQAAPEEDLAPAMEDAKLVSNMVMGAIFNEQGVDQLMKVAQGAGQNMPAAIAHALFLPLSGARDSIERAQFPVDTRVWTAKGGVVDRVIKDTAELLASNMGDQFVSPQFMSATKRELLSIMEQEEAAAQQAPAGMPGQPPMEPPAAPVMPEGMGGMA